MLKNALFMYAKKFLQVRGHQKCQPTGTWEAQCLSLWTVQETIELVKILEPRENLKCLELPGYP